MVKLFLLLFEGEQERSMTDGSFLPICFFCLCDDGYSMFFGGMNDDRVQY